MARTFDGNAANRLLLAPAVVTVAPFSMSCWFNSSSSVGERWLMGLGLNGGGGSTVRAGLVMANGSLAVKAQSCDGGGAVNATSSASASASTWSHAGGVWSAGNARAAYVNGANKGTEATLRDLTGADTTGIGVGVDSTGPINGWIGDLAEAAIWSVALDDAEMAALGKGFDPRLIRPTALVAYWPVLGNLNPEPDQWKSKLDMGIAGTVPKASHTRVIARTA